MIDIEYRFPTDFAWGTATSAHQVEGDNHNNDWWLWEQENGHICDNFVSGKACGWWGGRAEEDIERMAELNTNSHRLSVEWSRIEPQPGRWDQAAIHRYREILGAMRRAGIRPMVTLHHFTNPIWMNERGGWLNHDSATWFRRFVGKVVADLSDLCDLWCTINEPNVYATHSFFKTDYLAGKKQTLPGYFHILYHLTQAHAAAYEVIHSIQPQAQVGLAVHLVDWHPDHPLNPLDRLLSGLIDRGFNDVMLETLASGHWRPVLGRSEYLPQVINTLDWIGLNYYQRYNATFSLRSLHNFGIDFKGRPGPEKGPEW